MKSAPTRRCPLLPFDDMRHLNFAHARGIIRSLRPAMVRIAAEDNALAFPQPSALQIEDVLGARSGRDGAKENQSKE